MAEPLSSLIRPDTGPSLPFLARLAPPPAPNLLAAELEGRSSPGDVVIDLFGRGGWVARAAVGRLRRTLDFESMALTRLVAEVVLRPPDLRHFDAGRRVARRPAAWRERPAPGAQRLVRLALPDLRPAHRGRRVRVGRRRPGALPQDLPLHGLPRPAGRRRAALGAHGRRRHRPGLGAGRLGRGDPGAGGAAGALPRAGGRERPGRPHPGPLHGALPGGPPGHPRTHRAGPPRRRRSRPACAWAWPTRCCRRAACTATPVASARCASSTAPSACRATGSGASATRGCCSRTAAASCAGSSSASRPRPADRSRRAWATTCRRSSRARPTSALRSRRRPPCPARSRWPTGRRPAATGCASC